jgi:hypothetical protein
MAQATCGDIVIDRVKSCEKMTNGFMQSVRLFHEPTNQIPTSPPTKPSWVKRSCSSLARYFKL